MIRYCQSRHEVNPQTHDAIARYREMLAAATVRPRNTEQQVTLARILIRCATCGMLRDLHYANCPR